MEAEWHSRSINMKLMYITTLFMCYFFLHIAVVIIYRLTLHPLAKYPGPLLGRITDWYSVIRSAKGDRHIHFLRLHEKHGQFVRFGPNRISVNTAEGLQKIYGIKANTKKSSYYHVFNDVFKGDSSLTTSDRALHAKKKKIVSSALSENSVRKMENLILNNIRKFCDRLGASAVEKHSSHDTKAEAWSEARNMTHWSDYLSFDVMGSICFSGSFFMLDKKDNHYILDVLPEGVNGLNMSGWMPAILRLKLGYILFPRLNRDMKNYENFAKQQTTKRLQLNRGDEMVDVYSHLLRANAEVKEGERLLFTPTDLVGESSLLITGGSDTTATAITATLFYLLHNPENLRILENEILTKFAEVEDIRAGGTLSSCRWLRACIDEAMRMSPGVPGLLPREVLDGGVRISDEWFPPGVDLGCPHYALHHNEEYYPDSFTYEPSRWISAEEAPELGTGSERSIAAAHSAFCPFSIGPRGCVGKSLAMKEVMVTIARLVLLYQMRLAPGDRTGTGAADLGCGRQREGEFQMRDMFVAKTDGPMVQFRRR